MSEREPVPAEKKPTFHEAMAEIRNDALYYYVEASCVNCGWEGQIRVRKGLSFDSVRTCPSCECSYKLVRRA